MELVQRRLACRCWGHHLLLRDWLCPSGLALLRRHGWLPGLLPAESAEPCLCAVAVHWHRWLAPELMRGESATQASGVFLFIDCCVFGCGDMLSHGVSSV